MWRRDGYREKCNSGTEDPLSDQQKRKNRMEGRLLEVTEKSPMEKRDPVCSIFPSCGGCMYQTMSYEDQLAMKPVR